MSAGVGRLGQECLRNQEELGKGACRGQIMSDWSRVSVGIGGTGQKYLQEQQNWPRMSAGVRKVCRLSAGMDR